MSPTQASPTNDRDFPRLNSRNFIIWKNRVTAALDGKNLLGFVTQVDYAGDSDIDLGPDEELNPAFSEDISDTLNRMGVPKADTLPDSSSSESSDGSSDGPTEDDGDVDMGQENPPVIHSFAAQKQQELDRAEKLKAKSQRLSSKKLRLMEAKAKAFLIKTIDDQHVLLVKEKTTAFEIFQAICSNLEGSRKYIPYEDLKRNIETKVQNELARNRYVLKQGTPESALKQPCKLWRLTKCSCQLHPTWMRHWCHRSSVHTAIETTTTRSTATSCRGTFTMVK
ncbi:hypothetical protein PF004_g24738 [Phytophthora fragariae]|uniref:Uncharacterized protein n=1 Tax=Phytophthora fragariae TaxID=53985 RepID=A0A6G0MTB1_9STRA|nr:hypothetical protein PF004_g24738 [Phytophthora fragariae]